MSKRNYYIIIILLLVFLIIYIEGYIFTRISIKKSENHEKGVISVEITDVPKEYTAEENDLIYEPQSHINITNAELIYDLFTLEALKKLLPSTSKYLDAHGYNHITQITILEHTLIKDKSYPYFCCKMEGVEKKVLEIRYHLEDMSFEYQIIEERPQ